MVVESLSAYLFGGCRQALMYINGGRHCEKQNCNKNAGMPYGGNNGATANNDGSTVTVTTTTDSKGSTSVKPAKKSKTVKKGNAASFAWGKELDTANVSKIIYSSTDNSIAKIGKNGKRINLLSKGKPVQEKGNEKKTAGQAGKGQQGQVILPVQLDAEKCGRGIDPEQQGCRIVYKT